MVLCFAHVLKDGAANFVKLLVAIMLKNASLMVFLFLKGVCTTTETVVKCVCNLGWKQPDCKILSCDNIKCNPDGKFSCYRKMRKI